MTNVEISARHIKKIKRIEATYGAKIYRLTFERAKEFIGILQSEGIVSAKRKLDHIFVDTELIELFQDLYTTVGLYSYRLTTAQISKSVEEKGFGFNEKLFQSILNFFRLHILNKAVLPYTQNQKESIRRILEEGERDGLGVYDITNNILDEVQLERYRIERVVRTEAQFAMQYGRGEARNDSRWQTESEWIAANDHRTRHSHRYIDGHRVDEGEKFRVPIYRKGFIIGFDFMLGPGDTTASAGNVINCRCTMVTKAKRDKNGRLILKKDNSSGISVILPGERFHPHTVITI